MTRLINILVAATVLATLALATPLAGALDRITLKGGRVIEGDIVREIDGNLWVLVSYGQVKRQEFFSRDEYVDVQRDAVADVAERGSDDERVEKAYDPSVPKGLVLTLEGMVGIEMAAHKVEELIPTIETEIGEGGILVLKINSGGGALIEIDDLVELIQNKLKPRFEVVGWVESAISAAAMTGIAMERLYFFPEGNIGGAVAFSGALNAVKGRDLLEIKAMMQKVTAYGQRDYKIMEAMQDFVPLSATIDERGNVSWYQSEDGGEILVNPKDGILTLNSVQAEQLGFSEGIAKDVWELTHEMGFSEINWVGNMDPDEPRFPISKAEREMRKWRGIIDQNKQGVEVAVTLYQMNLGAADGAPCEVRGRLLGEARQQLKSIRRYFKLSPNLILFNLGLTKEQFEFWYEDQEEIIRNLAC